MICICNADCAKSYCVCVVESLALGQAALREP